MGKIVFSLVLSALALVAQTGPDIRQIGCRTNQAGPLIPVAVAASAPSGFIRLVFFCAALDPAGFKLDSTVTPAVVRLVPSAVSRFADGEVPGGTIDGTNGSFTLVNSPVAGSVHLFRNGIRQTAGVDYTVSGSTVSFLAVSIPQPGDLLVADYRF